MKVGDLVRLTFGENQSGYLVGALAIIEDLYEHFGAEIAAVLVTTGPGAGKHMRVTLQDITKLS